MQEASSLPLAINGANNTPAGRNSVPSPILIAVQTVPTQADAVRLQLSPGAAVTCGVAVSAQAHPCPLPDTPWFRPNSVPEIPPYPEILLAILVTFVGAMVQGSIGFGLAVVASPILLLINHDWVPGSLMVAATVLTILVAVRERSAIALDEVVISSASRLVATIPTAFFVGVVDRDTFEVVCGLAILLVVTISLRGYELPFNRPNLVIASVISGVTNTIAAVGGPPMALVYQGQRGPHIRATLSVIFAVGTTISMLALWAFGQFGLRDFVLGGLLVPSILAGFFVSRYLAPWVDAKALRPAVLTLAGGSALVLLTRALVSEWAY